MEKNKLTDNKKREIIKTLKKREIQFTIISIFVIFIILITSSYAIFSSIQKAKKYNTLRVGTLQIEFNDTEDGLENTINLNGAYPVSDNEGQETTPYTFKIKNTGSITTTYNIKLLDDTDMIAEDNCANNQLDKTKLKYSINKETPSILADKQASNYIIVSGSLAAGESKTYALRVWLSEEAGNEVLGKHYHGKIVLEGENAMETPNPPELLGDMIPVRYDDNLKQWVKSSTKDETWYNYEEQRWANAVTINGTNRSKYVNAKVGTTVSMDDINAMWVWIPRYSYTLGNTYGYQIDGANTPSLATPGAFNIKWIKSSVLDNGTGIYTGSTPDNYYTSSAFCWGDTCDTSRKDGTNEELSGIWVSKFELTGTIDSLTVKPNLSSVKGQNVATLFNSIQNQMNTNGNANYGLNGDYDAHMIKNTEWGAVAYLSQSKYGKYGNNNYTGANKEIYQNKSAEFLTGMSNQTPSTSTVNTQVPYDTADTGVGASTTGTIYGVYDMSGGAWEYVMGNYNNMIPSSGFETLPALKYYNKYTQNNISIKGDAINADGTAGFYNDANIFFDSAPNNYWLARGGKESSPEQNAGIFCTYSSPGILDNSFSSRAVIKP